MIEFLEIAGSLVGYVLVGMAWARSQAVRLQKMIKAALDHRRKWEQEHGGAPYSRYSTGYSEWKGLDPWWFFRRPRTGERALRRGLSAYTALWPLFMMTRTGGKLCDWLSEPIDKRREEAERLRDEAKNVRETAEATKPGADRSLLLDLAASLLKKAMERDL